MKLGSSFSLATLLALSFAACSPATASITDVLPRVRVAPGEALEVEFRFCIDGPRADSPFVTTDGMVLFTNEEGDAEAHAVTYVPGSNGDGAAELERVDVPRGEELESFVVFDDEGPWTSRDGRRCGDWQSIRVEVDAEGGAVWAEVSATMTLDVDEELGDDNLEIEWGELQIVADEGAERD